MSKLIQEITVLQLFQHFFPNVEQKTLIEFITKSNNKLSSEKIYEQFKVVNKQGVDHFKALQQISILFTGLIAFSINPVLGVVTTCLTFLQLQPEKISIGFVKLFNLSEKDPFINDNDMCYILALVNLFSIISVINDVSSKEDERVSLTSLNHLVLYNSKTTLLDSHWENINNLPDYLYQNIKLLEEYQSVYLFHLSVVNDKFSNWLNNRRLNKLVKHSESFNAFLQKKYNQLDESQNSKLLNQAIVKSLEGINDKKYLDLINKHHQKRQDWLDELMLDLSTSSEIDLKFPTNKEIFVSPSCSYVYHQQHDSSISAFDGAYWQNAKYEKNCLHLLEQILYQPASAYRPILLLGNPGSGKSFLTAFLTAALIEQSDFCPIYIRFRDLPDETIRPVSHINAGLKEIYFGSGDSWDCLELIKTVKQQKIVLILDGFDELLKASGTDLNAYIAELTDFMKDVFSDSSNSIRVILSSRQNLMSGVEILPDTPIIRLEPFEPAQRDLWWEKWSDKQGQKQSKFIVDDHSDILELAKEPILLFLLAMYNGSDDQLKQLLKEDKLSSSKLSFPQFVGHLILI